MRLHSIRSNFLNTSLLVVQVALLIAAFLIQIFEDDVSLSAIRFGYFIQPKSLSAICLAVLIILQGFYFREVQKKKSAVFFLVLGLAILAVNVFHWIVN